MDPTSENIILSETPAPLQKEIKLVDVPVTDENVALNLMVSFLSLAQKRGSFGLDESAKIWECVRRFQKPMEKILYSIFIKYKNITILLFIMGMLFSKIEKYFEKKYRFNNYDYEYDSIVKNEENNQYEEEDLLIYEPNSKIDYYNKKLEGIMYL